MKFDVFSRPYLIGVRDTNEPTILLVFQVNRFLLVSDSLDGNHAIVVHQRCLLTLCLNNIEGSPRRTLAR
jgi:hypothetical protein